MAKAVLAFFTTLTAWGQLFEVATIKPASFPSDAYFQGFTEGGKGCGSPPLKISDNRITLEKVTLCGLVRIAYQVEDYRVLGIPQWSATKERTTYFDIQAQAPDGVPLTTESVRPMLQALLADRFHLRLHREQRETQVYALVVAKNGPKLSTEPLTTCDGLIPRVRTRGHGFGSCNPTQNMTQLAFSLSQEADRPVVDRTDLGGKYAFFLQWSRDGDPVLPNSAPSLFTAIQEQLGLKLEPQKTIFDVIVIDSAEKPTEN